MLQSQPIKESKKISTTRGNGLLSRIEASKTREWEISRPVNRESKIFTIKDKESSWKIYLLVINKDKRWIYWIRRQAERQSKLWKKEMNKRRKCITTRWMLTRNKLKISLENLSPLEINVSSRVLLPYSDAMRFRDVLAILRLMSRPCSMTFRIQCTRTQCSSMI